VCCSTKPSPASTLGKHNNWVIGTDTGLKLGSGQYAFENAQFCFSVAVIKSVDDYLDLMRVSVATNATTTSGRQ
jgi:glutamine synthetase type III